MSNDRAIQGIPARRSDPKRMLAKNRPTAPEAETAAAPVAADTRRTVAPAEPAQAADTRTPRGRVNVYVHEETRRRAVAAFKATSYLEGDATWSAFVEKAILAEALRRESAHNGGEPYVAETVAMRPGRPVKD